VLEIRDIGILKAHIICSTKTYLISFSLAQSVKEEVRFNLDDVVPSAEDDGAVFTADRMLMY